MKASGRPWEEVSGIPTHAGLFSASEYSQAPENGRTAPAAVGVGGALTFLSSSSIASSIWASNSQNPPPPTCWVKSLKAW